jgi:glycosyltransferase involved in cell wall biosynthesis
VSTSHGVASGDAAAPTFTVVIPMHNAAGTVESAIRSVLHQTRGDFELVVVDDGSTDASAARVESFLDDPRIRLLSQPCRGPAAARNTGIRAGRAPLVALLDADDLWLPDYLQAMERALGRDSDAGFAYTDAWVLDDATGRIRRTTAMAAQRPPERPPVDAHGLLLMLARRNFVYTAATIRRDVLGEAGLYDERFRHGEDYELWLRIAQHGYHAVRADGVLAIHREDGRSLTGRSDEVLKRAVFLYATLAREHEHPEIRKIAAAQGRTLERRLRRVTRPTPADRLALAVRRRFTERRRRSLWLDEAPPEVADALARARS